MATQKHVLDSGEVVEEQIPEGQSFLPPQVAPDRTIQAVPQEDGSGVVNLTAECPIWLSDELRECKAGDLDLSSYEITGSRTSAGRPGSMHALSKRKESNGAGSHMSAAARLARARSGALSRGENRFEKFETSTGETFWIKRLRWAEVARVHLESSHGRAVLDLQENADALRAFTVASLDACVYTAPEEDTKYFTFDVAAGWVDSTESELQVLVGELSNACLAHNGMLFPQSVRGRDVPPPPVPESAASPDTNPTSSTSTSTSTSTPGMTTPSTEPPATSPTDLEAATSSTPTSTASPPPSSE